ncbi:drug/metabolite transporter (DMT)-like permease [Pararhizobium capsulatum DSM 1112]|uniref:Drug/metabolite transporter (DMT)-like permease n=1 Tax=Pararhizobium capsulatum DSM 1112 TaxID=1121113 RepID=A0ABU0BWH1_9HYPH|nr:DMT family transporter [Pararhizobium capsulatum]MDQ0321202.1 drug/metabolite transporter (DMT)-like permease [Pararhizobium capsulatum DSM 1112]
MNRIQANLLLLLSGAIWGAGFVAQSTAMGQVGPFWFTGMKFALAALVVAPLAFFETRRATTAMPKNSIRNFTIIGLALFCGAITQQIGLLTTSVTNSGFLTGLYVVFVPLLTVIFLRRQPHWIIWPAAAMAMFGIFLLSGGSLAGLNSGDLMTIVCAVFWAIQVMLVGIFAVSTGRPMMLSLVQFSTCAFVSSILGSVMEPISFTAINNVLPEILYAGILSSGVAFTCQVVAQRYTTAPQAAIFLSSEALFAALFGMLLLGETITPIGYVGCGIIFAAMMLVELVPELTKRNAEMKAST